MEQLRAKILEQEKQLDRRNREVDQTIRQAQSTLPSNDQKARQDLKKLLDVSPANADSAVQRPLIDPKDGGAQEKLSSNTGFMWIGSAQSSNLNTPAGAPVPLDAVQVNGQYVTNLDIYLRQGPPERPGYTQQASIGIMPEGTRLQVLAIAPPFARPTGDQYWAQIKVVSLALSTVYFQFAGGSREQAQQLSKALQDKGYTIPGEERNGAAANRRVVRYFYPGQKTIAQQLATDTSQAMQKLGYSSQQVTIELGGNVTKSNADGKLELWIEIPPK